MAVSSNTEIGLFDAKTHLSEIMRRVERGERFTITVRGRAVADVVPSATRNTDGRQEAIQRLMHPPVAGVSGDLVLEWIREGRR